MDKTASRAPLLTRIPGAVWSVLLWCAVAGLAAELVIVLHERAADTPNHPRLGPLAAVGVAVALAGPVGWTRRWPLPVLGVVVAGALVFTALGWASWPLLLTVTMQLGYLTATRPRWLAVTVGLTGLAAYLAVAAQTSPHLRGRVWLGLAATAMIWLVANSIRQRREYGAALRAEAASRAVLAERLRIARDLHDLVAHSIGIIALQAGMGSRVLDRRPEDARQALTAIELTSRETLSGLRRMLGPLRAGDPAPHGLAEIDQLAARTTAAGVRVDVCWQGEPRPVPAEIDRTAYRVIQEAVTNVVRHAGTDHCTVTIGHHETELTIDVRDHGRGGRPSTDHSGHGIIGMRERVESLGGRFAAGARPDGGFAVSAGLPW